MKVVMALLALLAGCKRQAPTPAVASSNSIVVELDSLPVGIEVIHTPVEVMDVSGPDMNAGSWKYTWHFRTEVRATASPLTITRFGVLAWDQGKWVIPGAPSQLNAGVMDQPTFIEWYNCPDAKITPGQPAVDPQNWAGSYTLSPFKQKWFYIGVDEKGRSFKGEAIVQLKVPPS